ncbi:MAG: MGMT family protein [Burkholderiales bacterium]
MALLRSPKQGEIYALIQRIPKGHVATYGQIATAVGGCTARGVGYALAALPYGSKVPWQRVINSFGRISARAHGEDAELQRLLLESEGIHFDRNGRIDLGKARWQGAHRRSMRPGSAEPSGNNPQRSTKP